MCVCVCVCVRVCVVGGTGTRSSRQPTGATFMWPACRSELADVEFLDVCVGGGEPASYLCLAVYLELAGALLQEEGDGCAMQ